MSDTSSLVAEEHKDYTGAKIGMWLFLFTELLLFGGMFLLYAVYRAKHPQGFHSAAMELDTLVGTFNTILLLTSSLTMVLSIVGIQKGNKKLAVLFLALTIFFGMFFLVNKYFEWSAKIHHGIYPNSAELESFPPGEVLFYGLYYSMTGLHGLHVIIGLVVLGVMLVRMLKYPYQTVSLAGEELDGTHLVLADSEGHQRWQSELLDGAVEGVSVTIKYRPVKEKFHVEDFVALENAGLYWHLVDVVWIFLFPLFYLIS